MSAVLPKFKGPIVYCIVFLEPFVCYIKLAVCTVLFSSTGVFFLVYGRCRVPDFMEPPVHFEGGPGRHFLVY